MISVGTASDGAFEVVLLCPQAASNAADPSAIVPKVTFFQFFIFFPHNVLPFLRNKYLSITYEVDYTLKISECKVN